MGNNNWVNQWLPYICTYVHVCTHIDKDTSRKMKIGHRKGKTQKSSLIVILINIKKNFITLAGYGSIPIHSSMMVEVDQSVQGYPQIHTSLRTT